MYITDKNTSIMEKEIVDKLQRLLSEPWAQQMMAHPEKIKKTTPSILYMKDAAIYDADGLMRTVLAEVILVRTYGVQDQCTSRGNTVEVLTSHTGRGAFRIEKGVDENQIKRELISEFQKILGAPACHTTRIGCFIVFGLSWLKEISQP